jgi:hypothetical protein
MARKSMTEQLEPLPRKTRRKAGPTDGRKTSSNMGRPLGSRDKYPRFPKGTAEIARVKLLETEIGAMRRENVELKQQLLDTRTPWRGDVASRLIATAKGEEHMSMAELYAGRIVYLDGIERTRAAQDERERLLAERDAEIDRLLDIQRRFAELLCDEMAFRVAIGDIKAAFAQEILAKHI